eukprot:CAMPEP_0114626932 /NCGR_PEP_ID=MMETSP0168-20121206/12036_1 /TAXON_ID=95228 ORGANISM="Vannella sp., Strain DIVA3 517/6/12" /NCGR_SAMPLE_ID=MMETSP0168 /ASSEMBLY_ACC=CAM_ASM_000044 /LENGTH=156 /DNA_ID=CAMNT_0001838251 /DNA_START=71 /DNA_END=541 /DNA_ORIENTATION=-
MDLDIVQATFPEDQEEVLDMVEALLSELGDEGGTVNREGVSAALEKCADRCTAFFAVDKAEGGKRVGLATVTETFAIYAGGAYCCIDELYVAKGYRGKGVGSALVARVVDTAKVRGYSRVDVTSPADLVRHARALNFYEREGFVFTGSKLKFSIGA